MMDHPDSDVEIEPRPNGDGDERDAVTFLGSVESRKIARMPVERNAPFYNMHHFNRGMAYIYNHEHFDIRSLNTRRGTNVDSDKLEKVLSELGFQVIVRYDYISTEVIKDIEQIANTDHSDYDCLLVVVLTHGESGMLYAKDTQYKPENLWYHFTSDKCPTLAGKPKLFFIQACQGDKLYGGLSEIDAAPYQCEYELPVHADFLIVFSTVPENNSGSWFIQALCEELRNSGTKRDILTLLTFVCQRVAREFESLSLKKQVPCITSMLTRLLKFDTDDVPNSTDDVDQPYHLSTQAEKPGPSAKDLGPSYGFLPISDSNPFKNPDKDARMLGETETSTSMFQ